MEELPMTWDLKLRSHWETYQWNEHNNFQNELKKCCTIRKCNFACIHPMHEVNSYVHAHNTSFLYTFFYQINIIISQFLMPASISHHPAIRKPYRTIRVLLVSCLNSMQTNIGSMILYQKVTRCHPLPLSTSEILSKNNCMIQNKKENVSYSM